MVNTATVELDVREVNEEMAFGFVNTSDDSRVGFIGGSPSPDATESSHVNERFAPFLFPSNWNSPTNRQMVAAWDALVERGLPGFTDAKPDIVRVVTNDTLYEVPREFLTSNARFFQND